MWESEERVLWNIKKLGMGIECLLNRLLADMGLTASRGLVLLFILEHPGNTICSTEIHKVFGVARPSLARTATENKE